MKRFLFSAFIVLYASITATAQELRQVAYMDGQQKLNGLVTENTGENLPGVLILPAWKGVDNEAKSAALELQKEGYIAFIADIYGEGNIPEDNAAAAKMAGSYRSDYNAYQKRIALALEQLVKQGANAGKIVVIGYCFGGTGALEAARGNLPVQGVVSIHGGLAKAEDRPNGPLNTKILIEHPAEDKSVRPEHITSLVAEMNEAKADWQMIYYAHCGHTFTNPESAEYNEVMANRAWQHTLLFLKEILN